MADVRGKSTKQNQLIAVIYDNALVENDNGQVIGGMVDFIRPDKDDPNPHLMTRVLDKVNPKTGKSYISNGLYYSVDQINAMYRACEGNGYSEWVKDGVKKQVFAVKADIVPTKVGKHRGLAVDTRTLGPADFEMTPGVLSQVYQDMAAAKEANKIREEQERATKDAVARERHGEGYRPIESPKFEVPGWAKFKDPGWEQPHPSTAAGRLGIDMDDYFEEEAEMDGYGAPDF